MLDNDLVDYDTFETAKYLLQDKILADRIMSYCTKNSDNINKISNAVKIYSSYTDKNDNDIIELIYKDKLKIVKRHYEELRIALSSEKDLSNWVYNHINRNAVVFSKREESDLHNNIKCRIKTTGLKRDTLIYFIDTNIISLSELTGSQYQAKDLDDVNNYIILNMKEAIDKYLEKIIKHVAYCTEKSEQLKIQYEKEQKLYNDRIKELEKQESSLRTERNSLGLFAFSKKKQLDEEIRNCIHAKAEFTRNHSPESIKLEYETYLEKSKQYV